MIIFFATLLMFGSILRLSNLLQTESTDRMSLEKLPKLRKKGIDISSRITSKSRIETNIVLRKESFLNELVW